MFLKKNRGENKAGKQRQTETVTPVSLIAQFEPPNHVWPQSLNSSCPFSTPPPLTSHFPSYSSRLLLFPFFLFSTVDFFCTVLPPAIYSISLFSLSPAITFHPNLTTLLPHLPHYIQFLHLPILHYHYITLVVSFFFFPIQSPFKCINMDLFQCIYYLLVEM